MMRWGSLIIILVMCGCSQENPVAKKVNVPGDRAVDPAIEKEIASCTALATQGEIAAAIERIQTLVRLHPADGHIASAYASILHRNGETEKAITVLSAAIETNPQEHRLYNNRGFLQITTDRAAALRDFKTALEINPSFADPHSNIGLMHLTTGQLDSAIEEFTLALEIDPDHIHALNNRGFAFLSQDQIDRALADMNRVLKLQPENVHALSNRGLLRMSIADFESAVVDFTRAMTIEPLQPKYYLHRREAYRRMGAYEQALADERKIEWLTRLTELNTALARRPQSVSILIQRADHWLAGQELELAGRDLERAIKLEPENVEVLLTRARFCSLKKDYAATIADCTKILTIEPRQEAYSLRGDSYLATGQIEPAIRDFEAAKRIDGVVAEAYLRKSQQLSQQGEATQAESFRNRAVALDPSVTDRVR